MPVPRNFEITDWHLVADCVKPDGTINLDSIWLMEYFGCDQYGGLAIFSPLYGFTKRIRPEWQSPTIDDSGSQLTWTHPETGRVTVMDLEGLVEDQKGHMVFLTNIPGILYVEEEAKQGFLDDLEKYLTSDKVKDITIEWAPVPKQDNTGLFYIKAGIEKEGHIFTTHNAKVEASVMKIFTDTQYNVSKVDFSILQATASAQLGTAYIGADAAVNLVGGQVSVFDANLGFGVGSGIGIRDEAIEVKLVGCGITVGKRIGISVFGNKIEINFGRFFDLF